MDIEFDQIESHRKLKKIGDSLNSAIVQVKENMGRRAIEQTAESELIKRANEQFQTQMFVKAPYVTSAHPALSLCGPEESLACLVVSRGKASAQASNRSGTPIY